MQISVTKKRNKKSKMWITLTALSTVVLLLLLWAMVTQPVLPFGRSNSPVVEVDPPRLQAHVTMLAVKLAPRDAEHTENLDRVAAFIREEFEQARGEVSEQPFKVSGCTYRNVIAFFGPKTKERVVIGAHYDAAGPLPGADDNASGVASLIELAHLLGKGNLPWRVELVAYTLEEPPYLRTKHMGSAVHAASLKQQGVPVRMMLSLEMVGYFTDAPDSQKYPLPAMKMSYPSQGNFIGVIGKLGEGAVVRRVKKAMQGATPLPVYSLNAPTSIPGVDFSDHANYWDAGYPATMITDTSFYRDENYHTVQDTPDTLDYKRMAQVVQGVYAAILAK